MKILAGVLMLAGCGSTSTADTAEKEAIKYLSYELNEISRTDRSLHVSTAPVDLNNDGVNEVMAYVRGESVCGSGGCNLFILQAKDGRFETISALTISWPPIRVLESKSNGWKDIAVSVQGGGILPGYEARLRFNGKSYPSNPSLVPAEEAKAVGGSIVIDRSSPSTPLN